MEGEDVASAENAESTEGVLEKPESAPEVKGDVPAESEAQDNSASNDAAEKEKDLTQENTLSTEEASKEADDNIESKDQNDDNVKEDIPEENGNPELEEKRNSPEMKQSVPQNSTPECLAKDTISSSESEPAPVAEPKLELPPDHSLTISDTNPSPEPSSDPLFKSEKSEEAKHVMQPPHQVHHQTISVIHRSAHPAKNVVRTSLTLNQMAIAASAQNKLPVSRLKGILERVGRHTESSAKKRGTWYKNETSYVDVNSYSWKNLSLYKDYQQHMWTSDGAIKSTCKK